MAHLWHQSLADTRSCDVVNYIPGSTSPYSEAEHRAPKNWNTIFVLDFIEVPVEILDSLYYLYGITKQNIYIEDEDKHCDLWSIQKILPYVQWCDLMHNG